MKRTTTSRSRSLAVLVAVLALGAGTAVAQDTLQTGQEGQRPRVHVVVEGETLWDLSALYLGDPLLWPDIYRLNTLVVEDPHWIFPGEELLLAPADATRVAQLLPEPEGVTVVQPPGEQEPEVEMPPAVATPPPPPPTEDAPTVFMRERMARGGPLSGIRGSAYSYRAVRVGEFYAAGFLTEGDNFPWAGVLGAIGRRTLGNLRSTSSAKIYNSIEIDAPAGAEYQIGDSLLVARIGREVSGGWGEVVVPTGISVVTHVSGRRVAAELVRQFGRVADGQVAMPLEPFKDPGVVVPVPVENGMEGRIVAPRDRNVVPGQQDIIFIDLGRADGVTLGDVFEVIRPVSTELGASAWEQVAVLHVVHVREQSSSAMLLTINGLGTEPGARLRLIRKMPS
jgi:hypothetical protein